MKYSVWLDQNKFTYRLDTHKVAQTWSNFMQQVDIDNLRPSLDPWHGLLNLTAKVTELNSIIDQLNTWLPHTIEGYFDASDAEASLNRLHIHFPEQERVETDPVKLKQLMIYNDLIHQIDLGLKSQGSRIFVLVCPDAELYKDFDEEDYVLFQPRWRFGDLMLHYPHVGRHPFEIFTTNDVDCPSDQIVCQSRISTSHTLRFFDAVIDKEKFKEFYKSSEITWPYDIDDPRLSFGYIKLGQLISVNDQAPIKAHTLSLVKTSKKITKWQIH